MCVRDRATGLLFYGVNSLEEAFFFCCITVVELYSVVQTLDSIMEWGFVSSL